jgi:ectoine hydroxylase-related dioxygenase (phytanoyl-CoA dioxygenase family)
MSRVITDEQAQFFLDNGYLVLRGVVQGEEFTRLKTAMDALTERGSEAVRDDPDYAYSPGHLSGEPVLRRIEYVIDKTPEGKVLLGNPFILRSVEKLIGPDFIPTWDSMVLKLPGEGIAIDWHRDAGTECVGDHPIFNVDFYLDAADEDTCVWAVPGSNHWSTEEIDAFVQRDEAFHREEPVPLLMQPGDVLFHNILVLHGSPSNVSKKLRRVLYYEFRSAHVEHELGPHKPEYVPLKQQVLLNCIEHREECPYIADDEEPFAYQPPEPWAVAAGASEPATYRYPHQEFWRTEW